MMIVDVIKHVTWMYDDRRPSDPPPHERHYVRLKVRFQLESAATLSERESRSLLVPLRQFLADSQGIMSAVCSQINVQMPLRCIDIISQEARGLCRGALFVDRHRRVLPIQVQLSALAPMGTLLDSTNALSPVAELPEAVATADEKEAPCSICWEAMGRRIVRMPCSHGYHKLCIARWLEKNHTCPLCRYCMTAH